MFVSLAAIVVLASGLWEVVGSLGLPCTTSSDPMTLATTHPAPPPPPPPPRWDRGSVKQASFAPALVQRTAPSDYWLPGHTKGLTRGCHNARHFSVLVVAVWCRTDTRTHAHARMHACAHRRREGGREGEINARNSTTSHHMQTLSFVTTPKCS